MPADSPRHFEDLPVRTQGQGESTTQDRTPHQDSAPLVFLDSFIESLISAIQVADRDSAEMVPAKLRLAVVLAELAIAGRHE